MAHIYMANGKSLVHESWPNSAAKLPGEKLQQPYQSWEVMPSDFYGMADWTSVSPVRLPGVRTRRYQLVQGASDGSLYQQSIRVEAFVKKHNFHSTGNWNETEDGAIVAKQFVELVPGNVAFREQFDVQHDVLQNALRLATNTIRGCQKPVDAREDSIFLQNPVFINVKDPSIASSSVLSDVDDMSGVAHGIENRWCCIDKVSFARKVGSNRTKVCLPAVFEDGDFISVNVTIGVVEFRRKKGSVGFSPCLTSDEVIQLCPASEIASVLGVDNGVLMETVQSAKRIKTRGSMLSDAIEK